MMKKALLVTTVSGFVPQFEMENVKLLQKMGYEVHYAANYRTPSYGCDNHRLDHTGIIRRHFDFSRNPFSLKNLYVLSQLIGLMKKEKFDLIHCHTPMGGALTRLAAHVANSGPVIYTAHGFHFYAGAPLKNWILYYPVERWLSNYTDEQICINQEDYRLAQKFHARYIDYIPGVGIDLNKITKNTPCDVSAQKMKLGLPQNKKILLSTGELIKRKNHETVIKAIAKIKDSSFIYVICGQGALEERLKNLVKKLKLEETVFFLGYRSDVLEIYGLADLFLFPSYQEGLPMAMMEAMACGLPVLCSDIRGNRELMGEAIYTGTYTGWKTCLGGGMVKRADDIDSYADAIRRLLGEQADLLKYGNRNQQAVKMFSNLHVTEKMKKVYKRIENTGCKGV